jgi:alpha-glucoside transport system permease protein
VTVQDVEQVAAPPAGLTTRTYARVARGISRGGVHAALVGIGLVWLVPSLGLFITSFRPRPDIAATGWWEIFSTMRLTLDNYYTVLTAQQMGSSFVNSVFITVPATLLPLFLGSLAAYAFSWIRFRFQDTLFLAMVALMIVPIQMALVPDLRLFNALGVTQSYVGIWLAHTTFGLPLAIFLLRNFFISLPKELIEAARVDGASNLGIFWRIVMPLSVPALASFGIFQFLWVWNDLLNALVFVQNPTLLPMTVRIIQTQSAYGSEWHLLSAAAFVLMAVPLVVFFSLQRYFVTGLLAGAVK